MGVISECAHLTHQQVADAIFARDGVRITRQCVEMTEKRALRKLAVMLAGEVDRPGAVVADAIAAMANECAKQAGVKRRARARQRGAA